MLKKIVLALTLLVFVSTSAFAANLSGLIPQSADFIMHINLTNILHNPEVKAAIDKNMSKSAELKKQFDKFVAETGFNPLKDPSEIMMFSSGKINKATKQPLAGVVINGKFDKEKLLNAIKNDPKAAKSTTIGKLGNYDAILPKNGKDGVGAIIDNSTIVMGSKSGVVEVLNVKDGKIKSISSNKNLSGILNRLDMKAFLSGGGVIPAELKEKAKKNPQIAPLASLNYFYFSFNYGNNIVFNFNGEVDKKENVETVMTSLNGLLAMIKMFAGQVPEATEILNMIKITNNNKTIKISLNVPKSKLEQIKKKIEERMKNSKKK